LAEDFEAVDRWDVSQRAFLRIEVWVSLEQDIWEAQAEVSAIDI